ncbi:hypothetical protein [Microbacterium hydrocarbonoxydans]|nr:hypothetical protein [Microbacterium hydrocarbonoxydans]
MSGTQDEPGAFVEGGYKPQPVALPPIDSVQRGTVYQDETGTIWRAVLGGSPEGHWLRIEPVTAAEHAALKRKRLIYLVAGLAATAVGWAIIIGVMQLPPGPPTFLTLFAVAGAILGFVWAWHRATVRLAAQIVAPAPGEEPR